jgi:hypothetical protein
MRAALPELTPDEIKALIAKLDDVCRQAQELQKTLKRKMVERARHDQQDRRGQPDRRKHPR